MKVSSLISDLDKVDTPLLVIGVLEPIVDDPLVGKDTGHLGKLLKEIIDLGDFKGENGEQLFLYTSGKFSAKRILLLGIGKEKDLTLDGIRKNFGNASRKIRDKNVKKAAVYLDHFIRKDFKIQQAT